MRPVKLAPLKLVHLSVYYISKIKFMRVYIVIIFNFHVSIGRRRRVVKAVLIADRT